MSDPVKAAQEALIGAVGHLLDGETAPYRSRKIIHDPIWGTTRLESWEAALLDIPYFQRLRGLKQTGFAHFTYPTAEHSRFQHTLGVAHAAGAIFDSLRSRWREQGITSRTEPRAAEIEELLEGPKSERWRTLLRMTALVHDLGHSIYSHTSERIFSLTEPFPTLMAALASPGAKEPGAAEVVVYLLVTSAKWQETATRAWEKTDSAQHPLSAAEWEKVGHWVMGQEEEGRLQFLADMISGPLDADKLDYIARDAYAAGLPITYDLERFVATVAIDDQNGRLRLAIPANGLNALEQLVMSRLVLTSYLYHHQKVRAAEVSLERALVRELLERKTVLDATPPWPLFAMEDADLHAWAKGRRGHVIADLLERRLPVRLAEFTQSALADPASERVSTVYTELLTHEATRTLASYSRIIDAENELADAAGLPRGRIIVDVPKPPAYNDLHDLELFNEATEAPQTPAEVLNYQKWIDAYKAHRAFVRVFVPRSDARDEVWSAVQDWFAAEGLALTKAARRKRSRAPVRVGREQGGRAPLGEPVA